MMSVQARATAVIRAIDEIAVQTNSLLLCCGKFIGWDSGGCLIFLSKICKHEELATLQWWVATAMPTFTCSFFNILGTGVAEKVHGACRPEERCLLKKVHLYILAAAAVVLSAFTICYFFLPSVQRKPAAPSEKVTIAYATLTYAGLAQVAQMRGYYQQEGLYVIPHLHPYGKPALEEVLEGKADFATVAETPFMLAVMNGHKVAIVATILSAVRDTAIIARKDKGILAPADLKGRKIAVTMGTTAEFFLDAFLAVHLIPRKDVQVINVKPEELDDVVASGDVDAVVAFRPFLSEVQKKLGEKGTTFFDENIYTVMFNVVATQKLVEQHPEKVKKLLRALVKAEEFIATNQSEAQELIARFAGLNTALVQEGWQDFRFAVKLDQALVLALEEESRWAVKKGLVKRTDTPDYLDYIYMDGLESVKPKAVRILQ
jgi:ABC-type nitrate/sulfonate/bicarbonate transport system substrate-binding protein